MTDILKRMKIHDTRIKLQEQFDAIPAELKAFIDSEYILKENLRRQGTCAEAFYERETAELRMELDCAKNRVCDEIKILASEKSELEEKIVYLEAYIEGQKESFDEIAQGNIELQAKLREAEGKAAQIHKLLTELINCHREVYSASPQGRKYLAEVDVALSATSQSVEAFLNGVRAEGGIKALEYAANEFDGNKNIPSAYSIRLRRMAQELKGK